MKCPKCDYLGFESGDRCRNCGYEFSLSPSSDLPELTMKRDTSPRPLDDLALVDNAAGARATPGTSAPDLPLFGGPGGDDTPLITRASAPRPPLAVRRATPEVPRVRAEQPRPSSLDLHFDDAPAPERPPAVEAAMAALAALSERTADRPRAASAPIAAIAPGASMAEEPAGVGSRLLAVLIDLAILAAVDLVVIYFTLQICGLTIADLAIIPKTPLIAFLIVQNGGYLVAFTAGGQTLGKMATGIRVVPAGTTSLDLGHALVRTIVWFMLAIPAGLGFLTALFSRDRRGLHDRFAHTRVVRATAV